MQSIPNLVAEPFNFYAEKIFSISNYTYNNSKLIIFQVITFFLRYFAFFIDSKCTHEVFSAKLFFFRVLKIKV